MGTPWRLPKPAGVSACVAMLLLAPVASADDPSAVIMTAAGDVIIKGVDGSVRDGVFGSHLIDGEVVRTGQESSAEMMLATGQWLQLGSGSEMRIGPFSPSHREFGQSAGSSGNYESVQHLLTLKDHRGTSAVSELRSGGARESIDGLFPRDTSIRLGAPLFRWSVADSTIPLRLRIYGDDALHWETLVEDRTAIEYPEEAPPLQPGQEYWWSLETDDPFVIPPRRSATAFFSVVSSEVEEQVAAELTAIDDVDASPTGRALLRASLLHEHGLAEDAIRELRTALKESSAPGLRQILAQLLVETGRSDEAVELLAGSETSH